MNQGLGIAFRTSPPGDDAVLRANHLQLERSQVVREDPFRQLIGVNEWLLQPSEDGDQ